jgi:hypothetical protein
VFRRRGVVSIVARSVVLGLALGAAVAAGSPGLAGAASKPATEATEVGVTPDEIHIAVVADVDTPLAPGAFKGSRDAVLGFAKYINSKGGLAGRKVVADFYDSKLNGDETRNAIIQACQKDFAIVGTSALLLNNVDDMLACPDSKGQKTGIPEIPLLTNSVAEQSSPVSFPIIAPARDFSDPTGETYRARVGRFRWYLKNVSKDLHGYFLVGADLPELKRTTLPIWEGAEKVGIKSDGVFDIHALDPQDKYLPMASQVKQSGSTIVGSGVNDTSQAFMLKESQIQGVSTVKVWDCTSACYSKKFIETAGPVANGQYVDMPFIPIEESKYSPAVRTYVKAVGADNVDGNGEQAWAGALLFRDVVNGIVKKNGVNGLTRANFLTAIRGVHSFNADGMLGTADIAGKVPSPCYALFQVKNLKFVRVYPKKPATFDCNPKNVVTIKQPGP